MAEVIRMPLLSDTMTEGKILSWNKKVGDKVKSDDVLAEVETDKATMEVNGYVDGTLLYIGVPAGEAAKINQVIAIVGKEGEDYKSLLEESSKSQDTSSKSQDTSIKSQDTSSKSQEASSKKDESSGGSQQAAAAQTENKKPQTENVKLPDGAKEIRMPLLSDTMTEGKIISCNKKVGDAVKADDVLADVETDKATMEVVGYEEGTLLYIGVEAGQAAKINQLIAIVGKAGTDVSAYVAADKSGVGSQQSAVSSAQPAAEQQATSNGQQAKTAEQPIAAVAEQPVTSDQRIKASPLAKKLAADKGIDISKVSGSGDGGRVTKKDIDSYVPSASTPAAASPVTEVKPFTGSTEEGHTDIPLTQMRKTIARRLGESKFSAPHFYLTMEINMDNAMNVRSQLNEMSPVKISFNDFIIKAVALSLRQHPNVNSSWMNDFIRQNHHIHIGSAVATPEGLIVPVIRFADQKSLSQIAAEAKDLYGKAKDKKLQPKDFSGNTFTISNLGMMDIEEFTAIINPPDSAILAVGRIKEVVVKKGEGFGVVNIMKLTMSCDHRTVDGAVGAAFLQTLKKYLENPVTMLL